MFRLFVSATEVNATSVLLTDEQFHHVSRVIRIKKNEEIDLVVDQKKCTRVKFQNFLGNRLCFDRVKDIDVPSLPLKITLVQGIPKQEKMMRIIDDVAQCGVVSIDPVIMQRTIVKWDKHKQQRMFERWNQRSLQAAMQSNLFHVPNVNGVVDFEQFISGFEVEQFDLCVVLWEEDQSKLVADIAKQFESVSSVCLVIGPEGGITRNEIEKLVSKGFKICGLGFNIFRVEIAGIIAISQFNVLYSKK